MKGERVARKIATEINERRVPQEWRDASNWMNSESAWEEDSRRVLMALLSKEENLYLAILALRASVMDQSKQFENATQEELAEALNSIRWWELHSAGILDGFDFRVWSFRFEDQRLHFIVTSRMKETSVLQFSGHLAL